MTIIVNDTGFHGSTGLTGIEWHNDLPLDDHFSVLDIPNTLSGFEIGPYLTNIEMIRIPFPSFADGRGFSIAKILRNLGFDGHLRAVGHVLADQYAMARRSGFDDVEIDDDLAKRQPVDQWHNRADWTAHDYQSRLRTGN